MSQLNENILHFLDNVIEGKMNEAKENLNVVLSRKAVEALDEKKKEIATKIFQ